jgi:hypothetical protein
MLIGIVGFIGSGKGTVGSILSEKYEFTQDSFAAPLKDAVAAIFGWDRTLLEGATQESRMWRELPDKFWSEKFGKPFSPRLALQLMGTEAGRYVFHKDVWVTSLLKRSKGRDTVITDVRFKNEINLIKENNGIIVRVRRGEEPEWYNTAVLANRGYHHEMVELQKLNIHISEWDWIGSPIDYTISNDGSLDDLEKEIENLMLYYNR